MSASKIKLILYFATIMFVVKPFVGFSLHQQYFLILHRRAPNILVKSFDKRKVEFSENSEFNIAKAQRDVANPAFPVIMLLAFAISLFLPYLFNSAKSIVYRALAVADVKSYPLQALYLLNGKLTI